MLRTTGLLQLSVLPRAAEVEVVALRREHVVGLVVDAAERDGRALFVALGGVVEDDVEDDLDAVLVQLLDQAS